MEYWVTFSSQYPIWNEWSWFYTVIRIEDCSWVLFYMFQTPTYGFYASCPTCWISSIIVNWSHLNEDDWCKSKIHVFVCGVSFAINDWGEGGEGERDLSLMLGKNQRAKIKTQEINVKISKSEKLLQHIDCPQPP